MKIIIFGATGTTGRLAVTRALEQGHQVTAFVRDPSRLNLTHARLHVVKGDVMNAGQVADAVAKHEGVIGALGVLPTAGADKKARAQRSVPVCSEGTRHILRAMQQHGVTRLVVLSATSVGSSLHTGRWGAGRIVRMVMGDIMADKEVQERLVLESACQWTIVRPVKLVERPGGERVLAGESLPWSVLSSISFADAAAFMVQALEDASAFGQCLTIKTR